MQHKLKRCPSRYRRLIREVLDYLGPLIIGRGHKNINIRVEFEVFEEEISWHLANTTAYLENTPPTDYDIKFDINRDYSLDDIVRILSHELIHVKQYYKCQLREKNSREYWYHLDVTDNEYYENPSEVEAYKLEDHYSKLFMDYWNGTN